MGLNSHERFENYMDVASPETIGDAKKITDYEENDDPYNDLFSEKLEESEMLHDSFLSPEAEQLIDEFDTRTDIDDKVKELPKVELPLCVQDTFRGRNYRTVEAVEDLTLYRVYGGEANKQGSYLTTQLPVDRMDTKIESALSPEWKNTREYYCEVHVPKGTIMNIGKVGEQRTIDNTLLKGGADQILVSPDFVDKSEYFKESQKLDFISNFSDFEKKANDLEK
ncbi:MAG: hypothetical protein Q4D26_07880 [Clostridia bacterium]|nr:hypothetical protein [Clostridia bacterium]